MGVVFCIIDSLPPRWVTEEVTPHLWAVAEAGGHRPEGARAVMSSSTYPNHATFATGTDPVDHRVITNQVFADGRFVPAARVGPVGTTIFDACARADRSTAAVLGDQHLVGVMRATGATRHWPPHGRLPDDAARDEFGYAADQTVLDAVDAMGALDADLAVVHFNEPDTACHLFGPDSSEARDRFTQTDRAFGELVRRMGWDDTVLVVVSDHDQEVVDDRQPFDLAAHLAQESLPGLVHHEGAAAMVVGGPGLETLVDLEEIGGGWPVDDDITVVWTQEGAAFGEVSYGLRGQHGSPRTQRQVAVVGGGHPAVDEVAAALADRRPTACDWAPTIARLLSVELPDATGHPLV